MRTGSQTSMHLLMAGTLTILSVMLNLIILTMSWEAWMVPLIIASCFVVWWLHIGKIGSDLFYENICTGLLLTEFFFFGVHESSLFEIPLMTCIVLLLLSLLNRKRWLCAAAGLYLMLLLYHFLILHTISDQLKEEDVLRLMLGASAVVGAVAVARYRINRRQLEQDKYNSIQEQLDTAVRQNADFLSNVSHELRTPVNMVIGISEVVLGKEISPEIKENIKSIKLAGKRLSGQINNILDFTEIVEGTLSAAKEPYRITSVMNDVITMIAMQNSGEKLEMVYDIDPRVPAVLIGDAEKISHVLRILLENSIKFTEEGGINLYIGFRRENYGINLVIDIYDTGIGMSAPQLEQISEDFYQADSGSRRYVGGLGLGIPIARGLVRAMGGFVHFESKEQKGMHVHIVIPQGVEDNVPCIQVPDSAKLCIACFFKPERYSRDEVRVFYDKMILHLVEGLNIEGYQAHNYEGLLKLQREHELTHIFIAQREYMANSPYYEELAESIPVAVIADRNFMPDEDSKLLVLRKPFFALTIVNLLGDNTGRNNLEDIQTGAHSVFTCTGVHVLAVDDEEMNLLVAKGVLGSYGIQVDTCLSGKEAVERCLNTQYDIIFLDHMMPGFDGVETLRRIREIHNGMYKELPVVALTANTISGAREMFRNEGFTEFIPKPIERIVLERVLRRVLPEHCIQYETSPAAEEEAHSEKTGGEKSAKEKTDSKNADNKNSDNESAENINTDNENACLKETAGKEGSSAEREGKKEMPAAESITEENNPTSEETSETTSSGQEESILHCGSLVRAGINVGLGLDYCGGEEAFYLEMLRMYCEQSGEKRAEIISLYEAADWPNYAIKVHALKSTSLTIGAEALSNQAKGLELASKKGDVEYIRENHDLLLQMYEEVCERIGDI